MILTFLPRADALIPLALLVAGALRAQTVSFQSPTQVRLGGPEGGSGTILLAPESRLPGYNLISVTARDPSD